MTTKFDLPKQFIIDGRQDLINNGACINWLHRFLPVIDKRVSVTIEENLPPHTESQRGYFHMCCSLLGKEIGVTPGEVKNMVKRELWGSDLVTRGKYTFEVLRSMEQGKANKLDYSDAIECVHRMAAECNVYLPDPIRR